MPWLFLATLKTMLPHITAMLHMAAVSVQGAPFGIPIKPCPTPTPTPAADPRLVAVLSLLFMALMTASIAAFYGWRRLGAPWRTVCFVIFAVSALLIVDVFGIGFASPDTATTPAITSSTPALTPTVRPCA